MAAAPAAREIPAGKILLAEYGELNETNKAQVTILDTVEGDRKTYSLIHSTPGFESAGSCARWTNGYYAVRIKQRDGSIGGRCFKTLHEAQAMLDKWVQA